MRKIDIMGKYLSYNNSNSDFSKIAILIPNSKYITRLQKNKFNKSINKSSEY